MSRDEQFPLNIENETEIVAAAIAGEALERVQQGLDFADLIDDPVFTTRTAGLVTPEMLDTSSLYDVQIEEMAKLIEESKKVLVANGMSEEDADRQVRGQLMKAFVQVQIEKQEKEK